jgi:hypothetical protein
VTAIEILGKEYVRRPLGKSVSIHRREIPADVGLACRQVRIRNEYGGGIDTATGRLEEAAVQAVSRKEIRITAIVQ